MTDFRALFDRSLTRFLRACGVPEEVAVTDPDPDPNRPIRRLPTHAFASTRDVPFMMISDWSLPRAFPRPGETWRETVEREVLAVRQASAIIDRSQTPRLEIAGADAGRFLAALFSGPVDGMKPDEVLHVDKVRGVDDRISVACLGPEHYLLTVISGTGHRLTGLIRDALDGVSPDIAVVDMTESTAMLTVAGPQMRVAAEIDLPAPGQMISMDISEVPMRLIASDFMDEDAIDILLPTDYANSLMTQAAARIDACGGAVLGTEACDVLALESGLLTDAELQANDGTAVWLKAVGAVKQISPEALVYTEGSDKPDGHVSRARYSPTQECFLAVAILPDGAERIGERVWAVDTRNDIKTLCEVTAPEGQDD